MTAATDKFALAQDMIIAQGRVVRDVTPNDDQDLVEVTKSILPLTTGNICVEPADGYFNAAGAKQVGGVIFGVTAGVEFDLVRVRRIYQTGTTANVQAIS